MGLVVLPIHCNRRSQPWAHKYSGSSSLLASEYCRRGAVPCMSCRWVQHGSRQKGAKGRSTVAGRWPALHARSCLHWRCQPLAHGIIPCMQHAPTLPVCPHHKPTNLAVGIKRNGLVANQHLPRGGEGGMLVKEAGRGQSAPCSGCSGTAQRGQRRRRRQQQTRQRGGRLPACQHAPEPCLPALERLLKVDSAPALHGRPLGHLENARKSNALPAGHGAGAGCVRRGGSCCGSFTATGRHGRQSARRGARPAPT
mgnify:CR=1 FL=1